STEKNELSPFQVLANHSCLALLFIDREELTPVEYKRVKASGVTFRGKKAWPVFSEYTLGYVPGEVAQTDQQLLCDILFQLTSEENFKQRAQRYKEKLNDFQLPYKIYREDGQMEELVYSLPIDKITGAIRDDKKVEPILVSPFE